jgi:hypothetical protein
MSFGMKMRRAKPCHPQQGNHTDNPERDRNLEPRIRQQDGPLGSHLGNRHRSGDEAQASGEASE